MAGEDAESPDAVDADHEVRRIRGIGEALEGVRLAGEGDLGAQPDAGVEVAEQAWRVRRNCVGRSLPCMMLAALAASAARQAFVARRLTESRRPSSWDFQPVTKSVMKTLPSHEYSTSVAATPQTNWRESVISMPAPLGFISNDQMPEFAAPPR